MRRNRQREKLKHYILFMFNELGSKATTTFSFRNKKMAFPIVTKEIKYILLNKLQNFNQPNRKLSTLHGSSYLKKKNQPFMFQSSIKQRVPNMELGRRLGQF